MTRAALTSASSSSSGSPPSRPLSAAPSRGMPLSTISAYSSLESSSSSCVPCAVMRPPSITITRSASAIVDRRCAITSVVRPSITSRSARLISRSVAASTLAVASSRTSTRGSVTIARAIAMRCRCPPDSVSPRSPTSVS